MKVEITIGKEDLLEAVRAFIEEKLEWNNVAIVEETPEFPVAIKFTLADKGGETS